MAEAERTRVLIADDEPSMRTTLSDILFESGFDVCTVENGESAVDICEQGACDVVLLDVRMPGIGGVEAFRRIRRGTSEVRVIMMSAYGDEDLKHEALQEGAIAFLDKPLNLETVIQLVADVAGLAVLAVTDDDVFSSVLPALFRAKTQRIKVVRSSDEALQLVKQLNFDVVLIDVELSATNGLDCYLAIRSISPTITAIMVSNSDEDLLELAEEAVRRTAYSVIKKPVQFDAFSKVVAQLGHNDCPDQFGNRVKPTTVESATWTREFRWRRQ